MCMRAIIISTVIFAWTFKIDRKWFRFWNYSVTKFHIFLICIYLSLYRMSNLYVIN